MTNQVLSPPFISEPPIYDKFLDENGNITNAWTNWLNSITRIMGYCITHAYLRDGTTNDLYQEIAILEATQINTATSTVPRTQIDTPRNGMILYNNNTNRMNFYENGGWVTFAPVAA